MPQRVAGVQQYFLYPLYGRDYAPAPGRGVPLPWPTPTYRLQIHQEQPGRLWFQMWSRNKRTHYGPPLAFDTLLRALEGGPNVMVEQMPAGNFIRMAQEYAPKFFGPEYLVHSQPEMLYPAFGVGLEHVTFWDFSADDNPRVRTLRLPTHEHPYFGGVFHPGEFDETQVSVAVDYLTENGLRGPMPLLPSIVVR